MFTPFLQADTHSKLNSRILDNKILDREAGYKLIPQVLSKNGERLANFSTLLEEFAIDEINLNMGCPYPTVTGKGRGSALMQYPAQLDSLLDYYFSHAKLALSIKLRTGFQSSEDLFNIVPILNSYPLSEIILHPRTASQKYEGTIDLGAFLRARDHLVHPLIYNGDIFCYDDYENLRNNIGLVDTLMIGRGLITRPYLAGQICNNSSYSLDEQKKMNKDFFLLLSQEYEMSLQGDSHYLQKMKSLVKYLVEPFQPSKKIVKKILKTKSKDHFLEAAFHAFS